MLGSLRSHDDISCRIRFFLSQERENIAKKNQRQKRMMMGRRTQPNRTFKCLLCESHLFTIH